MAKSSKAAPAAKSVASNKAVAPTAVVCRDHQRHTCIMLRRDDEYVYYIPLDILGFDVQKSTHREFDSVYETDLDYPVARAAKLYAGYATDLGGTHEAMKELAKLTNLTEEEIEMATAKQSAKKTTTAAPDKKAAPAKKATAAPAKKAAEKPEAKAKPATVARSAKPVKADGAPIEKKPSAAQMFKDLILEGKLTDDQIFAKVQKAFNLDDNKRSYVTWYRKDMVKKGVKVPAAK